MQDKNENPEKTRVLAAVVRRKGRLLIARRPLGKRHAGLWEFPGGKFLPGESPLAAARRELAEELGVTVTAVGDLLLTRPDPGSPFAVEFHEVQMVGEPVALEHSELAWVRPDDLPGFDLAPSDRAFTEWLMGRG